MTKANLSAVRWIDLDASLTNPCSWCRHSEFVHAYAEPCLFSECECPFFVPSAEPDVEAPGDRHR
jgi:hypothetical protein